MPLFTETYLKSLSGQQSINESTRMFTASRQKNEFDIFLSHSYLDKESVKGLYIELTNYGYSVYVDWIVDPHLDRKNVTKESAQLIQKRLKSSKSLLLAISHNAELSKWIPWELGYVDGHTELCALIPVARMNESAYKFIRSEYLLLYPYIKKIRTTNQQDKLWVADDGNKYIIFEDWMRNSRPKHQDIDITNL